MLNDYNELYSRYFYSHLKPDKLYSTLPTVMKLVEDLFNKTVLDLGCGTGFFTRELAGNARQVYGLDNSEKQINLARQSPVANITFQEKDIFSDELPRVDIVTAPYVMNYAKDVDELRSVFERIHQALTNDGRLVLVMDDPVGADLTRFGARKLLEKKEDGERIRILLSNRNEEICELHSIYYSRDTVKRLLEEVGFQSVQWHQPIVSGEGVAKLGEEFWRGYVENPELMYIVAMK